MKILIRTLGITLLCVRAGIATAQTEITFDEATRLPEGWESDITGKGVAKWEVIADDTAPSPPNALRQSGEARQDCLFTLIKLYFA